VARSQATSRRRRTRCAAGFPAPTSRRRSPGRSGGLGADSRPARDGVPRLLRHPGRAADGQPGRHQEGLPQAGAAAPPRRQQGMTRPPSGASRRSTRHTRCWAIPRSARRTISWAPTGRPTSRPAPAAAGRASHSPDSRLRPRRAGRALRVPRRPGGPGRFLRLLPNVLRRRHRLRAPGGRCSPTRTRVRMGSLDDLFDLADDPPRLERRRGRATGGRRRRIAPRYEAEAEVTSKRSPAAPSG
jgi:hypothetical protein